MNRCVICDYTEEDGSALTGRNPHTTKVHDYHGEYVCSECADQIDENYAALAELDDEVEGS